MHKCFVVEQHKRSSYVSVKTDTTSAICLRCVFLHSIDQEMSHSILNCMDCIAIRYLYPIIWLLSNCHLMRITLFVEYDKQTMVLFEFVVLIIENWMLSVSGIHWTMQIFDASTIYQCNHVASEFHACGFNSNEFAHIFFHICLYASCDRVSSTKLITLVTACETHAHWYMKMRKTTWIVQVFAGKISDQKKHTFSCH